MANNDNTPSTPNLSDFSKPRFNWRFFCTKDLDTIETIILPEAYAMFGNTVVKSLIETSIGLFVYVKPRCHELVAFISFKTYPNLPALPIPSWTDWIQTLYHNYNISSLNTYFVHWMTWCDPTYRSFDVVANVRVLFESIFTDHYSLQYIIFVLPPGFSELKSYQILLQIKTLYRLYPIGFNEGDNVQSLWVCERSLFFEKIIIRRALAEDNDDLVEILDADCKELRELYGDYYIAEIVLNEESTRKIIVAEYDNRAVGMICVNSNVNIDKYFEYFDLEPYHGLRKHLPCEIIEGEEPELEDSDRPNCSQIIDDKDLTIKEVSDIEHTSEEFVVAPIDPLDQKGSEDLSNLMGETYDIFKKFAFNSSSSSGSSISEQDWTSDVTLLQTRADLEIAEAKQARKNITSATNLIWGQLSINSSTRIDYKSRVKHSSGLGFTMYPKQYTSASNAFVIELHGIRSDYNKRLTYLLLEAVFETFPNRDYCLFTMPSYNQAFPGIEYFIKPIPRQFLQYEHELYLLYKYTFYGKIDVRIATMDNMPEITEFLESIPKAKAVLKTIEELLVNFFMMKYVINVYSNEMLIGLAILEICNELYFLRTNFDISSMVNMAPKNRIESNGFLKYFTLVPMYQPKYNVIVAEIFRLTGFKRLFYFVKDSNKREPHTTILPYLLPIRPRRRIVYHPEKLGDHVPPDYILQDPPLIALYTLSTSNLHIRKKVVSTRIVVVGPSTTALSFLETLIFEKSVQKFWFSNLVLISPHGHFETMINENDGIALARPAEVYYNYKYLQLLSIRTWVNIVHGYVTHIDKQNKFITITRDRQLKYDLLYIFTGLQFGLPKQIPYTATPPCNFLTVNSWNDAEILGIKVPLVVRKKNKHNIIVYGRTIEAYCILNYLLQTLQATDEHIVFVLPAVEIKNDFGTTTFNDEYVDLCIKNMIISKNVKIYDGYHITKWEVDKNELIRTVLLESKFEICQLDCSLLISCEKKTVGFETIKAFNDSGLVFDGRLVINKSFQTNDPDIYAAGPVTKYRRMLYADAYRHEYFNSSEIGGELALRMVAKLDPTFNHFVNRDFRLVVQKFSLPVIVNCVLPSKLNYLYITAPGPIIPHRVAILKDNYGVDITTGRFNVRHSDGIHYTVSNENTTKLNKFPNIKPISEDPQKKVINYFRCHLNEFNLITTIVCITHNPIDTQNIINLYGKHEKLLNNLMARYEANMLIDLYDFFQNSWWFYAVAHDRFACLQSNNKKIFLESMVFSDENLIKDIICLFKKNNNHKLTDERKLLIVGSYLYANQAKIEKNVLDFLSDYHDELPMFISRENVNQFVKKLTLEEVFHGIEELFIRASEL